MKYSYKMVNISSFKTHFSHDAFVAFSDFQPRTWINFFRFCSTSPIKKREGRVVIPGIKVVSPTTSSNKIYDEGFFAFIPHTSKNATHTSCTLQAARSRKLLHQYLSRWRTNNSEIVSHIFIISEYWHRMRNRRNFCN